MQKPKIEKRKGSFKFLCLTLILLLATSAANSGISPFAVQSLEQILKELKGYEHGGNAEVLLRLRDYILTHCVTLDDRRSCEELLLDFLQTDATGTAKMEVCRHLRTIGRETSVLVLQQMLLSPETSDMARYALEKIPGQAAEDALIKGLSLCQGSVLLGIISTLGHRRTERAVPDLGKLLQHPDMAVAISSATALGRIANPQAANLLVAALSESREPVQIQVASSLLMYADAARVRKNKSGAEKIYDQILATDVPISQRRAAMKGKILASGRRAKRVILDVLKRDVKTMGHIVISLIPRIFGGSDVTELCRLLPDLPASNQVQLVAALSGFRNPEVRTIAVQSLDSPHPAVRLSALETLGIMGDASTVEVLARYATQSGGKEKIAARQSLWRLKGRGIDREILAVLEKTTDPNMKTELIQSLAERRITNGKEMLLELSQQAEIKNRLDAIKALSVIAEPSDITLLINILLMVDDAYERREMIETVAEVAARTDGAENRSALIEKRLPEAKSTKERNLLYRIIGRIGDNHSLPILRRALQDPDEMIQKTALNALANWPDPSPRDVLYHVAKTTPNPTHQVLALRGFIRMIRMQEFHSPEEGVRLLAQALQLARRPEEKKFVLGILPQFPCQKGIELAESLLQDGAVRAEAKIAVNKIAKKLR